MTKPIYLPCTKIKLEHYAPRLLYCLGHAEY